jgi:hypothetical protein
VAAGREEGVKRSFSGKETLDVRAEKEEVTVISFGGEKGGREEEVDGDEKGRY